MAINFPNSPTAGSTYTYQGITYTWIDTSGGGGADGYWKVNTPGSIGTATGPELDAGTDNAKYATALALEDSSYSKSLATSDVKGLVEMATTVEAQAGTSDLVVPSVEKVRAMQQAFIKHQPTIHASGTSGTYNIPDNVYAIEVTLVGAGAGGGGASGSGTGVSAGGGGGAGGGMTVFWTRDQIPSSVSWSVGNASAGGSSAANAGNGGASIFHDIQCNGGEGGSTDTGKQSTLGRSAAPGLGGTIVGTATGNTILARTGGQGYYTVLNVNGSQYLANGANGGNSLLGTGGVGRTSGASGLTSPILGGGGAGAAEAGSSGRSGGAGGGGYLKIVEYYS